MENEKETKKKLKKAAFKEFSEKGFMKASLRNICKEAGLTTGALYFFFSDKEDLFDSLIEEPLKKLNAAIENHFIEEMSTSKKMAGENLNIAEMAAAQGFEDDKAIARDIVHLLFEYRESFELLLTKAQGTRYENIRDMIVDKVEDHYTGLYVMMKGIESHKKLSKEDKFIIHWMSHDQIEVFIHILLHCKNEKEALNQMEYMIDYIVGGWFGVINSK